MCPGANIFHRFSRDASRGVVGMDAIEHAGRAFRDLVADKKRTAWKLFIDLRDHAEPAIHLDLINCPAINEQDRFAIYLQPCWMFGVMVEEIEDIFDSALRMDGFKINGH